MVKSYIQTNTVNHNFNQYRYGDVLRELNAEHDRNRLQLSSYLYMLEPDVNSSSTISDEARRQYEKEINLHNQRMREIVADKELLARYPQEFPVLYAILRNDEEGAASFEMREVLAEEGDIVTEAEDVLPKEEQLELFCSLEGAGSFGIIVEPYDKAGEDSRQLRAKISFSQKAIDDLNQSRLNQILEFCEKRGLSVYDIDLPYKDGMIDVDEKLASLTRKFLEDRQQQDVANPGPNPNSDKVEEYVVLDGAVKDINLNTLPAPGKAAKKLKTFEDVQKDMLELIETDLKKSRGLSFFEHWHNIDGRKTVVFSLYDKPNRDNEDLDGLPDKNKNHVPTYSYRLYASQDPKTGRFVFGYATPGGKKIDDVMAGDLIGVIKKTGVTHINFSNLPNAEKMVWLLACAEKGITPIGISIAVSKAKSMVEAARKKLTDEEFALFKLNLSTQMLENAEKKNPTAERFGLTKSEHDYIMSLKDAYEFENFRVAFNAEGGLYDKVDWKIKEAGNDRNTGAATSLGAMHTLRAVFDIYFNHPNETLGARLDNLKENNLITAEERAALSAISANTKLVNLTTDNFKLMYDVLLPGQIQKTKNEIEEILKSEIGNKVRRAPNVVIQSDLFPKAKGAVNGINNILRQHGLDSLELPLEHSGLYYADKNQRSEPENTPVQDKAAAEKGMSNKTMQNGR